MSLPLVMNSPAPGLLLMIACVAAVPVSWIWLRRRGADRRARLAALTALTLFLTFDLIVFGAFTRLSDSGLGCPDWPGCYGELHPLAASDHIAAAEAAMPTGPVTPAKAWIEMIHRYLAMLVGALITVLAVASWQARRELGAAWWWPLATWVWVVVQGMFGRWTVTLKLYPAVVTAHLLGAMVLLTLLLVQHHRYRLASATQPVPLALPAAARAGLGLALLALVLQIALGGWVSTNYAVLACQGFPQCNGAWWPDMDWTQGFVLLRDLGRGADGGYISFPALVAIHWAHRLMAAVLTALVLALAVALWRSGGVLRRWSGALVGLLMLQVASGIGNVVLQWPLAGALAHSAGAAALLALLVTLALRSRAFSPAASPVPEAAVWRPAP